MWESQAVILQVEDTVSEIKSQQEKMIGRIEMTGVRELEEITNWKTEKKEQRRGRKKRRPLTAGELLGLEPEDTIKRFSRLWWVRSITLGRLKQAGGSLWVQDPIVSSALSQKQNSQTSKQNKSTQITHNWNLQRRWERNDTEKHP